MDVDTRRASLEAPPGAAPAVSRGPLARVLVGWLKRAEPRPPLVEPVAPPVEPPVKKAPAPWRAALSRIGGYGGTFVLFVALPSLASAIYFAFIASNQYVAEARFAVRAAQFETYDAKSGSVQLSSLGLPALAGQDAYVVAAYVRSAAVFADLPPSLDPRVIYSRPEADFWARLDPKASLETLTDYWRAMVSTYVDGPSGVVTVAVRAFRPEDAQAVAKAVVAASETLVNRLSERARRDAMAHAEEEVRRAEGLVLAALAEERAYRDRQGFIDPASQATSTSTLILQAMAQRIELQNDYEVDSRAMSPTAPTVLTLKARLDALDGQIDKLKAQLTSDAANARTVSASIAEFEALETKRLFAEKLYSLAQDALERARRAAEPLRLGVRAARDAAGAALSAAPRAVALDSVWAHDLVGHLRADRGGGGGSQVLRGGRGGGAGATGAKVAGAERA